MNPPERAPAALGAALALALLLAGCQAAPAGTGQSDRTERGPSSSESGASRSSNLPTGFDLEAHRGGRGETTEESRRAFEKALDLGVTTLEFDIVLAKDATPVVWHDPEILPEKCADTAPATPDDPQFPYVGDLVHELTWEQLQTLDCSGRLEGFPNAEQIPENRLLRLSDVFALTKARGADVHYNIETKLEAIERSKSAEPEEFVDAILAEVDAADVADKVMIQSFDWRSLPLVHRTHPDIPLVLLWDETTWISGSQWTGDVDFDEVGGDIVEAAKRVGAAVLSPGYTVPYGRTAGEEGFRLVADKALCDRAHAAGLAVVPWTINDPDTMAAQIDAGADGIISDYPTMLRSVMDKRGMDLPTPYPAK